MKNKIAASNLTLKVNFNLRKLTPVSELTPINCVIRYNNEREVISKVEVIEPKYWNTEKQEVKMQIGNARGSIIKSKLLDIRSDLIKLFDDYVRHHNNYPNIKEFKQDCLKVIFPNKTKIIENNKLLSFYDFIERLVNDTKSGKRLLIKGPKKGQPYSPRAYLSYNNTLNVLKKFVAYKQLQPLTFNDIDLDFYNDFKDYAYSVEKVTDNYLGHHIKNIKLFMNEALEAGLHSNIKFKSKRFVRIQVEADTIYLDETKVDILYNLDLTEKPRLDRVRDLVIMGVYTGLRFSDLTSISAKNIVANSLHIKTKKTQETVVIPIHQRVREIMNKYQGRTANSFPPALSNVKMNVYIKDLAETAGFDEVVQFSQIKAGKKIVLNKPFYKLVTSHSLRRSFSTNMFKMGVPITVIMGITGHKTEVAFRKYIRISSDEKSEILRAIWEKPVLKVVND